MKSDTQAISGQTVTATTTTRQIRLDGAVGGKSAGTPAVADYGKIRLGGAFRSPTNVARAVADQGKIRLGGAFRLPASRKAA
jgi:hypothetical protein